MTIKPPSDDAAFADLDPLEAEMAALFADTAVSPDSFAVTRMAERAKDIPAVARRRKVLGGRWLAWMAVACAMALVVGSAAWMMRNAPGGDGAGRDGATPMVVADATSHGGAPKALAGEPAAPAVQSPKGSQAVSDDGDELAALEDLLGGEDDGLGLDALHLPEDTQEAEAMLDAYDDLLGDG